MNIDYSKMLSGAGRHKTQALFHEFKYTTGEENPPYNLKEREHAGSLSMYQIYMAAPSEYEAAYTLLNSWKHWEILCKAPFFVPYIEKWREEREIREAAIGKATLIEQAEGGNVAAAKALMEPISKRKAGRPTKNEIEGHKNKAAKVDAKVSNILERMAKHD